MKSRRLPRLSRRHGMGASLIVLGAAAFAGVLFIVPQIAGTIYVRQEPSDALAAADSTALLTAAHLSTPEPLRGIYMSQCVSGTPTFRESLLRLIRDTDLNAVAIDIKDYTGYISFVPENAVLKEAVSAACGASDMKDFIEALHAADIYVIGRITVFQDPRYAALRPEESVQSRTRPGEPWKDYKGLSFVSVSSKAFWDYIVELSKESYALGFDELNYDYIRWPSDGPMSDIAYPSENRAEEVEKFFRYLHGEMKPTGVMLSADLFGYTTVLTDDLGIGQILERALPYFAFVMPMVYPSHYNKGFEGLANPNSDPYKVVYRSMSEAVRRTVSSATPVQTLGAAPVMKTEVVPATETTATSTREATTGFYYKESYNKLKLRPWLQDFDYGKDYLPADIEAQIRATTDTGLTSWIFWDPANRYDSLRNVLAGSTNAVGADSATTTP